MSYVALYRKYRPQSFSEVVGQKHIVRTLQNALTKNRIAHAYLFCGPRGTGKTSIAKIFAKTLNCTDPDNKPCGKCESCTAALSGTHPDIIEIDAASNNGVDDVRAIIDQVSYMPILGKYKIYIIDEVHMMTTGAFNALLKTIEEPPEHVIFILATTEPDKVLPTILSRCQRFDFTGVDTEEIEKRLADICKKENVEADTDALSVIASLAEGGMRDSLSILDQCIAYEPDHIEAQTVRKIYGVITDQDLCDIFTKMNPEEVKDGIQILENFAHSGMDLKRFISSLIRLLKNSLLIDFSENTDLVPEKQKQLIQSCLLPVPQKKRLSLLEDLLTLSSRLGYSGNLLDHIETILLKHSVSKSENSVSDPYEKTNLGRNKSDSQSEQIIKNQKSVEKMPNQKDSRPLEDLFWGSDVSRETFSPGKKLSESLRFSDDFILSMLVGAMKSEKKSDTEKLLHSNQWRLDLPLKFGKFSASLKEFAITASGDTYLVLTVHTRKEADLINDLQSEIGYEDFMERVLGKPKKVFALSKTEQKHFIDEFKKRSKNNSLPRPAHVELNKKEESENQTESTESILQSVFPEVTIVDD